MLDEYKLQNKMLVYQLKFYSHVIYKNVALKSNLFVNIYIKENHFQLLYQNFGDIDKDNDVEHISIGYLYNVNKFASRHNSGGIATVHNMGNLFNTFGTETD